MSPPRLDLANEDLVRAHVQATWLAEAGLSLGKSLKEVLDLTGDQPTLELKDFVRHDVEDQAPPDVIVIRGAPGSGKSETAKRLAARLGHGARVEVDTLRAMIVPVDWTNQQEHMAVLSLAVGVIEGFLRLGHRPVIVVDTFSGDKLVTFLKELGTAHPGADVKAFSLAPSRAALRARIEGRPDGGFKDVRTCEKLNADVARRLVPREILVDNSSLTPDETVDLILRDRAEV